jgi:hypothetical protein
MEQRNSVSGMGDRTIGYANCLECGRAMRRTGAKITAEAVLVQFECPGCPGTPITCAMVTEDDLPIRLDWFFCGVEAGATLIAGASAWHRQHLGDS